MADENKKADTAKAEADAKALAEKEKADAVETEEETEEEAAKDSDTDIDYDAELEAEKKRGKPDPFKAKEAFKERKKKREEETEEEEEEEETSEEDRPITRKDLATVEANMRQRIEGERALEFAKGLAGSAKEAELVIARWNNRRFPDGTPLSQQIEEVFAGIHAKKLIGERQIALKALKTRDGRNTDTTTTHRDGLPGKEPTLSSADKAGMTQAGFTFNKVTKRFEKKLQNGQTLIRDLRSKATYALPKGQ